MNKQYIHLRLQELAGILDAVIMHEEYKGRTIDESDIILDITKHDNGMIELDVTVNPFETED